MSPLNRNEIKRRSLAFWLLFVTLLLVTVIPAYFFVWAASAQQRSFVARQQSYREMYNKQILLKDKVDSLYARLYNVNIQKVDNYLFLEELIVQSKSDIHRLIGADSTGHFLTYSRIIDHMEPVIFLKDSIVRTENNENMLRNDLLTCINKNRKAHRQIFQQTQIAGN